MADAVVSAAGGGLARIGGADGVRLASPRGGVYITIEGMGEQIVARKLMRFAERLAAPTAALEVAATILREATEKQFTSEGRYASGGWPELAASTIAKRGDDGHPILRVTDALMESLTRKFDERHFERLSVDSLRFGSTVPYGIYHQSSRPRYKIPYRPPIALTKAAKVRMVKEMQAAILGVPSPGAFLHGGLGSGVGAIA